MLRSMGTSPSGPKIATPIWPGRNNSRMVTDTCGLSEPTVRLYVVRKAADGMPDCAPDPTFPAN